jgi:dienelactone hydrolase
MPRVIRRRAGLLLLVPLLLAAVGCNPLARGPDPTEASVFAPTGPFTVATLNVPATAGFGGGTVFYPSGTTQRFAAVSIFPGFFGSSTSFTGWGQKLASNGFVTIIANSSNGFLFPDQRSTEQLQALDWLRAQDAVATSPLYGRVDTARSAVIGHSMGGGASLISTTKSRPDLKAAIPLAPWNTGTDFPTNSTPTLIWACQADGVAPVAQHASPMYEGIPAVTTKQYISVAGADHFCANNTATAGGIVGAYSLAWLKRFVDNDTRYDPWVCGAHAPAVDAQINEVRQTCPEPPTTD